jgi:hypothetical protein
VIGFLRRQAFRRGVLGNSRGWFALWAGIGVARFLKARVTRDTDVVERITLKPGETIEIRDTGIQRAAFPSA